MISQLFAKCMFDSISCLGLHFIGTLVPYDYMVIFINLSVAHVPVVKPITTYVRGAKLTLVAQQGFKL